MGVAAGTTNNNLLSLLLSSQPALIPLSTSSSSSSSSSTILSPSFSFDPIPHSLHHRGKRALKEDITGFSNLCWGGKSVSDGPDVPVLVSRYGFGPDLGFFVASGSLSFITGERGATPPNNMVSRGKAHVCNNPQRTNPPTLKMDGCHRFDIPHQESKASSGNLRFLAPRLYFMLKKKTPTLSVTVSPCELPIEWSLAKRTLKDKPLQNLQWSSKKSVPELWWQGQGTEEKLHGFSGNTVNTYSGTSDAHTSVYILRLRCKQQSTRATVYLHQGPGPSGVFPLLPADPRVHTLGVGMTSVTLSWAPSIFVTSLPVSHNSYDYCVLTNLVKNYPSVCAVRQSERKDKDQQQKKKDGKKEMTAWPILKKWWWQQWDTYTDPKSEVSALPDDFSDLHCACQGTESVCTVSELMPDTQYYFDVFVIDRVNGTSVAYKGTHAQTHEEAKPAITMLREGELRWVTFTESRSISEQFFSFRPRGWQQSGLLTLQSCSGKEKVKVTVSFKGRVLTSQNVGADLVHIWLNGSPSYLIHLEGKGLTNKNPAVPGGLSASVKMQTSSAYHRQGLPSLPSTLQIKSFNRLRGCTSVTLAWMGTEERSLYCVYRRKIEQQEAELGVVPAGNGPCLGPESRSDTERVLCKYFQELNPRRAVTTAVIEGLEPGVTYMFDVYLMRRWGIPIKYVSKMVKTRKEC